MSHNGRKQMNIVHKAILHACWQQENQHGMHVVHRSRGYAPFAKATSAPRRNILQLQRESNDRE
jgi:hypothetical protein